MGMEGTSGVAADLGALAGLGVSEQSQAVVHDVEDSSLYGFESIANIRECAGCDNGEGVVEVASASFVADRYVLYSA
jgi:hypothetical protein